MSINGVSWPRKSLQATLCEIERGLFYVTYPDLEFAADAAELSAYQVGANAAEVKWQVERSAHLLGYETVVWHDANNPPIFPADPFHSSTESPARAYNTRSRNLTF
jgi:hypothetical protein